MTTPRDSDLRRLFDDAVSEVQPEDRLEEIRARGRRPSAGRWVPLSLAAAVATVLVIGGAAWLAQRQPSSGTPVAGQPAAPTAAPSGQPDDSTHTVDTTVYYLGATAHGPRLFPEQRRVTDVTDSDLQVAVQQAISGSPQDPDYQNPWGAEGVTVVAQLADGTVHLDLSEPADRPDGMDDQEAQMAVQALVWTADSAAQVSEPVTFTVGGAATDQVLGVDTSAPVARTGEDAALAPVLVTSPAQGATVSTEFTVEGRAAAFEANVVWELKRGETVVRHGFTTAQECCTLSPYSFAVTAPPGDYTLVVHDTDESGGEGVGTSQDTKDLTVE